MAAREDRATAIAAVGGLGLTIASVALPLAYPEAAPRLWQFLLWGGVGVLVLAASFWARHHVFGLRRLGKKPMTADVGSSPADAPVSLSLRFTDPEHQDHTCELDIKADAVCNDVVVIGRFALLVHYLSGARWKWSHPQRLAEAPALVEGETVSVPYYARPSAARGVGDSVSALGRSVPLGGTDAAQGEMVRIEVTIHTDKGGAVYDRVWQFRRADGKHYTDALDASFFDYPDDKQSLG